MKVHANAALGPAGRLALCEAIESGMTLRAAAAALNVAPATAHRWWHRWRAATERGARLGRMASRPLLAPPTPATAARAPPRRSRSCGPAARPASARGGWPGSAAGPARRSGRCFTATGSRGGARRRAPDLSPLRVVASGSAASRRHRPPGALSPPRTRVTGDRAETSATARRRRLRLLALRRRRSLALRLRRAAPPTSAARPRPRVLERAIAHFAELGTGRARGGDERQRARLSPLARFRAQSSSATAPATSSPRPTRRAGTARSSASSRP